MQIGSKTLTPKFFYQSRKQRGRDGEQYVVHYLEKNGYEILTRNYRLRDAEIDIIVRKETIVAFVEVKARAHEYFSLSTVITRTKQNKMVRAALHYCALHELSNYVYRFDVALVRMPDNQSPHISYLENAFEPSELFG